MQVNLFLSPFTDKTKKILSILRIIIDHDGRMLQVLVLLAQLKCINRIPTVCAEAICILQLNEDLRWMGTYSNIAISNLKPLKSINA